MRVSILAGVDLEVVKLLQLHASFARHRDGLVLFAVDLVPDEVTLPRIETGDVGRQGGRWLILLRQLEASLPILARPGRFIPRVGGGSPVADRSFSAQDILPGGLAFLHEGRIFEFRLGQLLCTRLVLHGHCHRHLNIVKVQVLRRLAEHLDRLFLLQCVHLTCIVSQQLRRLLRRRETVLLQHLGSVESPLYHVDGR